MPTLPTSIPSADEPSADDFQAMLDLLAALSGMPIPVSASGAGNFTSGATELADSVLPTYQFVVPSSAATWRYRVNGFNIGVSTNTANDSYRINVRDGGASAPTTASTLVASAQTGVMAASGAGQLSHNAINTWVPGAGTHTLGVFLVRISGTGSGAPVSVGTNRELSASFHSFV